jgi:CarD family transcriptional regulator
LVKGFDGYYVIEFPAEGLMVHVPMEKVDDLGVRPVVSKSRLDQLLRVLTTKPDKLPDDYKERQGGVREKLATGRAMQIAETVRDLAWREERAYLTRVDRRLFDDGRDLLASEIALVTESEVLDAEAVIDEALATAMGRAGPE